MQESSLVRHRFPLLLALVAATAFLLRLGVVWELRHTRSVIDPVAGTDMRTYWRLASSILEGRWPEVFYFQPFYYSVFMPVVLFLFGGSALALGAAQAALGAATVWLVGWSSSRWFGPVAGLAAAICLTLARFHIFYTPFALMAVLQGFWLAALVAIMVWMEKRGQWWQWFLLGLVFACANLTRGNIIILLPGILLYLAWCHWREWRPLLIHAALFLIVAMSLQLPFSWRNWQYMGRWTGPSTAADAVLSLGNNPEAPPGGLVYTPTYEVWMQRATATPPEERVAASESILEWARQEPLAWLELKFRAALLFWDAREIPNNVNIEHDGQASRMLRLPFLLGFWVLASLGLAGLAMSLGSRGKRRHGSLCFAAFGIAAYWAGTAVFYILARFRLPVLPLLCLFAGYFIHRLLGEIKLCRRRGLGPAQRQRLARVILSLLLPLLLLINGFRLYQEHLETAIIRWVRPHGVLALAEDDVVVYDHGPAFLGGWNWYELEPGFENRIDKIFSLPNRRELTGRQPGKLRIPLIPNSESRVQISVQHQGREVGRLETTIAEHSWLYWLEVEIELEEQEWLGQSLELAVAIRYNAPSPLLLAVDTQRDYERTRLVIPEVPEAIMPTGFEAAIQLIMTRKADYP